MLTMNAQEQIRLLVENPPKNSVKMTITPEMALEMLTYNEKNRPISASTVKLYSRIMKKSGWIYTGETIIFSESGIVLDGQHRLLACIESGETFECDVVFGRPNEGFKVIDSGKKRSAGDLMAIEGLPDYSTRAAITRVLFLYYLGRAGVDGGTVTADEVLEFYNEKLDGGIMNGACSWANRFTRERLGMASILGAAYYLCVLASGDEEIAQRFMGEVLHGGPEDTPGIKMHKLLIRNATAESKMRGTIMLGLVLKAWNKYRKGQSGVGLKFGQGEKLPEAI